MIRSYKSKNLPAIVSIARRAWINIYDMCQDGIKHRHVNLSGNLNTIFFSSAPIVSTLSQPFLFR